MHVEVFTWYSNYMRACFWEGVWCMNPSYHFGLEVLQHALIPTHLTIGVYSAPS